jgi:hypothetical protein
LIVIGSGSSQVISESFVAPGDEGGGLTHGDIGGLFSIDAMATSCLPLFRLVHQLENGETQWS